MFRLITFVNGLLILVFLFPWRTRAEFIYDNIFEYALNLTAVYKDPAHVYGEDLLRTAVFYLDELMELEDALKDKDEEKKALKMLEELYKAGGPQHIKHIPYSRLIDTYNWKRGEIDDLASYIEKTSNTWDRLLICIEDFAKSGKININDHSGHLPMS